MTRRLERLLTAAVVFLMSFCICIVSGTITANAASGTASFSYAGKVTVYNGDFCSMNMGSRLDGASSVSVTSSKNSVIKVYSYDSKHDDGYIDFDANKTGTATITVKVRKNGDLKTYTTTVESIKYTNPFKTFTVGGNSVKNLFGYNPPTDYGNYKNTMSGWKKVTITEAANWDLVKITHKTYDFGKDKWETSTVKNSKVDLSGAGYYDDRLYVKMKNPGVYNGNSRTFILYL